jgi:hypothetical protein
MKDLTSYIKENDSDNIVVKQIDNLVRSLVENSYMYNTYYGESQTKIEALKKLKTAMSNKLNDISDNISNFSAFDVNTCQVTGDDDNAQLEVFSFTGKWEQPRSIIYTSNDLKVKKVTSADVTHNSIKIGNLSEDANLQGIQCGVASYTSGSDTIYVPVTFRFNNKEAYAIFSDTSFLSDSGIDLSF